MNIQQWAIKWGVSPQALAEFEQIVGIAPTSEPTGDSEARVQSAIRLEAGKKGVHLWRNNVGACYDETGRFIRYGIANDSKRMNEVIKSSDLIGIRKLTITPEHVGTVVGQFVAREVKAGDWRFSGTKRELAQLNFLSLINACGGDAAFAVGEGTL